MQGSETQNARPGFVTILCAAVSAGLFAGALFGVRETFRVCLTARRYSWMPSSLGYILGVGGYAVALNATVGAGFTMFLGLLVWVAVRVRRLRAGRAAVVALGAAGLAFVLLFLALWDVMSHPDPNRMFISQAAQMAFNLELGAVSLLAAGGLGALIYLAASKFEHWAALLSAAVAIVCAAFLAVVWSAWLIAAAYNTRLSVPALGRRRQRVPAGPVGISPRITGFPTSSYSPCWG
jgi:hypothetical protein